MEADLSQLVNEYGSEENIAERIREELKARGWSQAKLAKEMAANGYAIHQSAISKIVAPPSGDGRRSVSVDEALGFAKTFGVELQELLVPGYRLFLNRAGKLIAQGAAAFRAKIQTEAEYQALIRQVTDLAVADIDVRKLVVSMFDLATRDKAPEEVADSVTVAFLKDVITAISEREDEFNGE
jgi:transcriptional regulator with XRE-family HTH domain